MLLDRLKEIEAKYDELTETLANPEVLEDQNKYRAYTKELASLTPIVEAAREFMSIEEEIAESKTILDGKDDELKEIVKEELPALKERKEQLDEGDYSKLLKHGGEFPGIYLLEIFEMLEDGRFDDLISACKLTRKRLDGEEMPDESPEAPLPPMTSLGQRGRRWRTGWV